MTTTITKPRYIQIADELRERISNGELKAGDRLPSYTEMYRQFGAATNTVQRACDLLEQEALIERRGGSGIYVSAGKRTLTGNLGILGKADFRRLASPFFIHLAHGTQEASVRHGRRLVWLSGEWNEDIKNVDGLLLSGHPTETNRNIARLKPAYLPCVSMFIMAEGMNSVVVDDYGAAKLATRHLLELGHRRIACLLTDNNHTPQIQRNRLAGYQDALQEAGIIADPLWARRVHFPEVARPEGVTPHQSLLQWSREQMQIWLQEGWRALGCTAILAQNDHMAIGVMQILQEAGVDVPGEVSVMGFDGTELCDHTTPRLSSVQLPLEQVGARAVELLVEQIESGQPEEQIIVLPAKLRAAASTAPVKKE